VLLQQKDEPQFQLDLLRGLSEGLRGQRTAGMPAGWDVVEKKLSQSDNEDVRFLAQSLSLTFGSQNARTALRQTLKEQSATPAKRRAALDALAGIKDPELPPTLQSCCKSLNWRPGAPGIAGYNDPRTPDALLGAYGVFDPAQRRDALNTLVSRVAYAKPLLTAVEAGKIPLKDLTADIIRHCAL
jgi:HEAT repeat protein